MTKDEKRQALQMWVGSFGVARAAVEVDPVDLQNALYAISECGLWPDNVASVSEVQAFTCWQLIERLRQSKFPDSLKM